MAKDRFFSLSTPFERMDVSQFELALRTSRHIRDVLYFPDELSSKTVDGVTFENVSFSKTKLSELTFKNCRFDKCLFIGTKLEDVDFHSCIFVECNFFKAVFARVYGNPSQFVGAISLHRYANVAVHLFQGLRNNYSDEMQPEYRQEAEYHFRVWKRRLEWAEISSSKRPVRAFLSWVASFGYGLAFGYGYRLRNLMLTTLLIVTALTVAAHQYHGYLFVDNGDVSVWRSIYFTVSTMVTMGAVGFTPSTDFGFMFVLLNALCGVILITATVSSLAKRVAR